MMTNIKSETAGRGLLAGIEVRGAVTGAQQQVLSPAALAFLAALHREFEPRRQQLLRVRQLRQQRLDAGELPDYLPETCRVREDPWQVLPVPEELQDRRVEITGPAGDPKMVINALNSGASCYMADFEDSHSPTWAGTLEGQLNLRAAVRGELEYTSPEGKRYRLYPRAATLFVRPRGWHLPENHVEIDGEPVSASLFDFAMFCFHNAHYRVEHDSGIYVYLPKLEHYLEARLWNDVFVRAQKLLEIPQGTIKATVLIEHILAAFQMEEILYELRHHSAGLNCGRWDYLFSYIKKLAARPGCVLPDRGQVGMTAPMMRAYTLSCIRTCHRRGTFAMGGMSAYIPVKADPAANARALEMVREDKRREAMDGHDGTWVAHPGLVAVAREEFDKVLRASPNQIHRQREEAPPSAAELLECPSGTITEPGLRANIRIGIQYLAAWLDGMGCVPLYNLMEDAATAEISRTQVWQWIHHPEGVLDDGRKITETLVADLIAEEMAALTTARNGSLPNTGRMARARQLFEEFAMSPHLEEFLTLKAYEVLLESEQPGPGNDGAQSRSPQSDESGSGERRRHDSSLHERAAAVGPKNGEGTTILDFNDLRRTSDGNGKQQSAKALSMVAASRELENEWRTALRWRGVQRDYTSEKVLRLRGTMAIEHTIAAAMSRKLWHLFQSRPYINALGALTGNQAVQMAQAGLKAIYLSGWQVAADANLGNSMYPDQSLYPANSVPQVVRRINKALQRADQIQCVQGEGDVDYWLPIVADAEAGFGGPLNVFELMLQMIEEGAAGVHYEDQLASAKKCGHMGGKVLVPGFEFVNKLTAARLAADVAGVPIVLVARTDAEAARLLTSDFDERDKPFCTGTRTPEGFFEIRGGIELALARALAYAPYADVLWCETGKPDLEFARRFAEGVQAVFPHKLLAYNCSPSFNWKKNLDDFTIRKFQRELSAMGYRFQFVTLAGFHALNLSMWELARGYKERQMAAYAELQEREFAAANAGYSAVRHQAFVGTGYFDEITTICGQASTQALRDSTEEAQFSGDSNSSVAEEPAVATA